MTALYFGVYNPAYSRNRVLIKGLKANGVEIIECRTSAKDGLKYLKLFWKFILSPGFDLMIVGFPGQEVMFMARVLTRKKIIFDAFTSHYEGYILDRRYFDKNSLRAKYYRFVDKYSCRLADLVLLDTQAHIDFFVKEYDLPVSKFRRIFVGTDTDVFYPANLDANQSPSTMLRASRQFTVHFHGSYVPLQGISYIIKAAKLLENDNIKFNLIGRGQTYTHDRKLAESLQAGNINFMDDVAYNKLPKFMNQADIVLGIFGDSPKTQSVIPNKVYEALAMQKPIITADTSAIKELLTDRKNVILCQVADAESLAAKILELKNNPNLRGRIAQKGYEIFKLKASEEKLGGELIKVLNYLI